MDASCTMRGQNTEAARKATQNFLQPSTAGVRDENTQRKRIGVSAPVRSDRPRAARSSPSIISRSFLSLASLFSAIILFAVISQAQVAVDAGGTAAAGNLTPTATTLTFAHTTTTTGTNLVIVVGISLNITGNTGATVSTVTYAGKTLTKAFAQNNSNNSSRAEIWYATAPASGTNNVVVTVNVGTAISMGIVADAVTFTGADQTTPIRASASNTGDSANAWVNVTSSVNDYAFETLALVSGTTAASTSTAQVQQWATASTGALDNAYGFGSTRAGSASVAFSETLSGTTRWADVAVSVQPAQASEAVTATGSSTQYPANLTYVVTVTNNGPDTATSVSLTNALAAGLTFVSAVPAGGVGGACTGANCTWTSIASGSSASVTITATPSVPGGYPLSSTVTASSPDLTTANNSTTTVSYSEFDECYAAAGTAGGTLTGVINTYYPGTATATSGSTSITVGVASGAGTNIAVGDLVLIIQMQDAAINTSNSSQYGDGISGSGSTSLNNAGVYEYATATSAVTATTGGTLSVEAAGPGGGLLYTYTAAAATSTQGARTFQVVRVPNYSTATLSSTLTAAAWNGSTGGILALNVSGTLTLGGATVSVSGLGFRGGAPLDQDGATITGGEPANTDYVYHSPAGYNTTTLTAIAGTGGSKGEGVAGTPEYIENVTANTGGVVTTGTVVNTGGGYPSGTAGTDGSLDRGAPGNAGGGANDADPAANDQNAGGGGGANGGAGGQGGDSWNTNLSVGGLGGTAFPGGISRVVMGGGGGAGTSNNNNSFMSSSAAPGGGIVMIRAVAITGNVTIDANGFGAYNATPNDGGGGGGAAGSIVFLWGTVSTGTSTIALNAIGGRGGDAWDSDNGGTQNGLNNDRHGPGGGGGGGVILYTGGTGSAVTATATGGAAGITLNTTNLFYGASAGGTGTSTSGISLTSTPGPHYNATCTDLSITKTGAPSPVIVNAALAYTITVTNTSTTTAATGITVTDSIPTDVIYNSYTIAGGTGGTCSEAGGVLSCTFTSIAANSSATITVKTTANTAYTEAVNTAIVDSATPDPNPVNNTATASVPIEGPTSVRLSSFSAAQNAGSVLLMWKTGGELHNLGFNVYRDSGGEKVLLNSSLISGSALLMRETLEQHGAKSYAWIDRSPQPGALYWLEDVDLNGTRTMHGPVSAQGQLNAELPRPATQASTTQTRTTQAATTQAKTIADLARETSLAAQNAHLTHIRESVFRPLSLASRRNIGFQLAAQSAVKIFVDHEGWYQVTQPQLVAAGLRPNVEARSLHLFAEGVEQPIRVTGGDEFGPQSAIEFYGTAIDTPYSGQRVYWLTTSNQPGLRIGEISSTGSAGPPEQSFIETVELKPRTTYFAALLRENTDNFFGPLVSPTSTSLEVDTANTAPGQGVMEVALQGLTDNQQHDITVTLNGATLGEVNFANQDVGKNTFEIPAGVLVNGANTITLTSQLGTNDLSLVDYIDVSFPHTLSADSDSLKFSADEGQSITVGGFDEPPARLVDITDPLQPVLVNFRTIGGNGQYALSAGVPWTSRGQHTFLAVSNGQLAPPVSLALHIPSSLHAQQRGAQVVLLTYPDFVTQLQPLATLHQAEGRSVALLTTDQIYDEFNFGERTPYAIKDFLRTATAAWRNKPGYLLLGGDASVDPRDYLGFGFFDFVPTKIVITSELKTASDDWFSDFNNTGFATIATGRLPGRTTSDLQTMVSKIVNYVSSAPASWANQAMMVADVDDSSSSFSQDLMLIQKFLPSTMNVTDVFASTVGTSVARQDILAGIENGQVLVNYNGHGSVEVWSGSDLFDDTAASTLTNGYKLPFFVIMNCLNGFFHDVYTESMATALMLSQNGGAVAVWASSGLTAPEPQFQMNQTLVQTLYAQPSTTLGDAVRFAKSGIGDEDVRKTFILFGDPLMRLKQPMNSASGKQ